MRRRRGLRLSWREGSLFCRPLYLIEDFFEACGFLRIEHLYKGDAAGEVRAGQRIQESRIGLRVRQRRAPTSRALRDQLCAGAQLRSRDEFPSYSRFPGVTPERPRPDDAIEPRGTAWASLELPRPAGLSYRGAAFRPVRLQIGFVDVAPLPVFAALGGLDEGVAGLVEVGAGVAVLG
jgi:hypothetical protein